MHDDMNAPWNHWNPPPLALDDRVFVWTSWLVRLKHATLVNDALQVCFERHDRGQDMIFRDRLLGGQTAQYFRPGLVCVIIGLCEEMREPGVYYQEFLYTTEIEGGYGGTLLSQGVGGQLIDEGKPSGLSRGGRDRQRVIVHYLREMYFWARMRSLLFDSAAERKQALVSVRRHTDKEALKVAEQDFRIKNARRYFH